MACSNYWMHVCVAKSLTNSGESPEAPIYCLLTVKCLMQHFMLTEKYHDVKQVIQMFQNIILY